jgi:hypothetical protein
MASIPKTRDQPEEPNSKRSRSCGNNASTEISRLPPTRQQMRGPMSDRRHTPHLDAGTTTGSAHTNNANGVRAGRPRPADNTPAVRSQHSEHQDAIHAATGRTGRDRQHIAESGSLQIKRPATPASGACPRCAPGRDRPPIRGMAPNDLPARPGRRRIPCHGPAPRPSSCCCAPNRAASLGRRDDLHSSPTAVGLASGR